MSEMVEPLHKDTILRILRAELPKAQIIAFGSRIRGNAKEYSDLDLCVDAGKALTMIQLDHLNEAFAATNIPYKIDICDWHSIDPSFKEHIRSYGKPWTYQK